MVDGEDLIETQKWHILSKCPWITVNLETITTVDGLYQLPRYYAYATNPENKEYEYTQVEWSTPEFYDICKRIGRGKYSEVFSGVQVDCKGEPVQDIIIKVLKPIKKRKQRREIFVLKVLKGGPNIVNVIDVVRDPISRTSSLIYESIGSLNFHEVSDRFSDFDRRFYFFQMLLALDYSNSKGIMHRDIKPHNVVIDPARRALRVIDWGLAEFYTPGEAYNVRVASRHHKAPELLINYNHYDYSLDMWSLGCMFAGVIFGKEPFFVGSDNIDQLVKIADVLGTDDLYEYCNNIGCVLDKSLKNHLGTRAKKNFDELYKDFPNIEDRLSDDTLEFLDAVLRYDHRTRTCPIEALFLPYFEPVRQMYSHNHGVNWNLDPELWKPLVYAAINSSEASYTLPDSKNPTGG